MCLIIASMICSVSIALCYISDLPPTIDARSGMFFLAKTIQGFAVGGVMCTIQTWLSEVMPTELRGPLMALFPIFKLLGQLVGALVCLSVIGSDSKMAYRTCFATQWPFSGALTIFALFLPESPVWLLRKAKDDAAMKAMVRLRGSKVNSQVESALSRLRDAINAEKQDFGIEKGSYLDCFKKIQRRRTAIVCFAEFIPLLFGLQLCTYSLRYLTSMKDLLIITNAISGKLELFLATNRHGCRNERPVHSYRTCHWGGRLLHHFLHSLEVWSSYPYSTKLGGYLFGLVWNWAFGYLAAD